MISKKAPVKAAAKGKIGHLVTYLLDQKGKPERVAAVTVTNCQCDDPRWAVHEMQAAQGRNQRAKGDKTYHLVVSFRAGENVSSQALGQIEEEFCRALGFEEHQRISVVHRDTDNLHLHVAINKVHPAKLTLHEPFNDYHTRAKLCQRLEQSYGLEADRQSARREVPSNEKATVMESVAGVESLIGYVQRRLAVAAAEAKSWHELHAAFAEQGVELKPRGNGLVVQSGGKTARASSCFRGLSQTALERRLGPFQPPTRTGPTPTLKKAYQHQPMQKDAGKLYAQYQGARREAKETQTRRLAQALADHRHRVGQATFAYRTQRAIIGLSRRGTVNTLMLQLHRANLKSKLTASFAAHKAERKIIYQETKLLAWNDWLMSQAASGSKPALTLLQSRAAKRSRPFFPAQPAKPISHANAKPNYRHPGVIRTTITAKPDYRRDELRRAPAAPRPDYHQRPALGSRLLGRAAALLQSRLGRAGRRAPAGPLASVRDVSGLDVVYDRPGAEVLLRTHEPDRLGSQERRDPDPAMRRPGSGAGRTGHQESEGGSPGRGQGRQAGDVKTPPLPAYVTRGGTVRGAIATASKFVERAKGWTRGQ